MVSLDSLSSSPERIKAIVEKPKPAETPSNLAVVGRYILTPRIFEFLETGVMGATREIQLTDAISQLLAVESVQAYQLRGKRYDCGSKLGYLQAVIAYALKHPEMAKEFRDFLSNLFLETQ
jgi:UTP--glucose-1-phosphate uridylyltransferase